MTGAAGGLSGGLWAVHGATLEPGAPWILDALDFDQRMRAARAVVTGEGKLDEQTLQGKLVGEIGTRTRQAGVPLHAIVGTDALDAFGKRMIDLQVVTAATTLEEIEAAGEDLGAAAGDRGGVAMFERFTPRARQVVALAQDEARGLGHGQVGTEHLLLGLIAEETGAAGRAFATARRDARRGRDAVMALVRPGEAMPPAEQIPFSPRAKGTLEASLRQAIGLKDTVIGTEHILLALLIERDGRTASVLASLALPARPAAHDRDRGARRVGRRPTRTTTARRCSCSPRAPASRDGRWRRSASRPRRCGRRSSGRAPARNPHRAGRYLTDAASPAPRAALARARGAPSSWAPGRSARRSRCCSRAAASAPRSRPARPSSARGSRPTARTATTCPASTLPRELRIESAASGSAAPTSSSSASPRAGSARSSPTSPSAGSTAARP